MTTGDDHTYTESDPRMHALYEEAQLGQMTVERLAVLSDDELLYLAGHEPSIYFDLDAEAPAQRIEQRDRRSKLTHNRNRAKIVLERRWVERSEEANRLILSRSLDVAASTKTWTKWLVVVTFGLTLATIAMAVATIVLAARGNGGG